MSLVVETRVFSSKAALVGAVRQYIRLARRRPRELSDETLTCLRGALLVMGAAGAPDELLELAVTNECGRRGLIEQ